MADICFAAVWSRDKFPAKINKLTRDHIDLWTKLATVGSTCLQHDTINLSDQNHIILLIRVSQILMKENNEFINIFQASHVIVFVKLF